MNRAGEGFSGTAIGFAAAILLLALGCNTVPKMGAVNLSEPGWNVRQGQAVWRRQAGAPEIVGDVLVATRPDGRAFAQFSKGGLPFLTAQSTASAWQVEVPTENKRYSGHGKPPKRLIFLYLARALQGKEPPRGWIWQGLEEGAWRLVNPSRGESLEVHFGA